MWAGGGNFPYSFWQTKIIENFVVVILWFSHGDSKWVLGHCLMQSLPNRIPQLHFRITCNFILKYFLKLNYSFQDTVGWLGFWSQIVACGTALISGHVADKLIGHFKMVLLILLSISTFSFIWMCFICTQIIPFSIGKYLPLFPSSFHHVWLQTTFMKETRLELIYNSHYDNGVPAMFTS